MRKAQKRNVERYRKNSERFSVKIQLWNRQEQKAKKETGVWSLLEAKALGISAVCAGIYFCYSSIISFLTPYANEIHLQTAAAFFFIVYSIAILITRPFTGRLFDQRGAKITMLPAFLSFFVGMIQLCKFNFLYFLGYWNRSGTIFLGFLVSPLGYRGMYLAMAGMTILFMIFFLPYY